MCVGSYKQCLNQDGSLLNFSSLMRNEGALRLGMHLAIFP